MVWVAKDLKAQPVPNPLPWTGCDPPEQAAHGSIPPGLEIRKSGTVEVQGQVFCSYNSGPVRWERSRRLIDPAGPSHQRGMETCTLQLLTSSSQTADLQKQKAAFTFEMSLSYKRVDSD